MTPTQFVLASASMALALSVSSYTLGSPAPQVEPARISDHIKVLGSDAYEGRGPATPAEARTLAYIEGQMQAIGLSPGGDLKDGKRVWTQDVPLGRFEIAGPIETSVTGGGTTQAWVQGQEIAIRAAQTGADRVDIKAAPLVFVGYGVTAPERQWDDFKGVDVRGKVIVVLINDPDFEVGPETKNGGDFGGKAMTYYGRWTYKYEEAARRGAAGVLIVHETAPASYGWNTVKNSNTNTQFDIVRDHPEAAHVAVEAWIQRDAAVALFAKAGLDFDALRVQARSRDFRPVVLPGASFSTAFAVNHSQIVSHNVLGILRGTVHPDQTIFYTAHWDHLGVGQPDAKGDRIYNGALDNASGVGGVLEMARVFASTPRTKRSIVFMTVTAEEKGLLGSAYYASHPLYPLGKTVGVFNTDDLDADGPAHDLGMSGDADLGLKDDLVAALARHGRRFASDPDPGAGHFFRSDHFSFAKVGVPAISINSGRDLLNGGKAAGDAWKAAFTRDRYHQPADQWDPGLDFSGEAVDLNLLVEVGRDLANSDSWPGWGAGSEFKATRDKTAGLRR